MRAILTIVYSCFLFLPLYAEDTFDQLHTKAEQGDATAQLYLAGRYLSGKGVIKNEVEAYNWFKKSAEQGDAKAQYGLGLCYFTGTGVVQNTAEAVKWWQKAAEQGDANSQRRLYISYKEGEGVIKNDVMAYQWLLLSSADGDKNAKKMMPEIERQLTLEQRSEGQRLATEWQAAFEKRKQQNQ